MMDISDKTPEELNGKYQHLVDYCMDLFDRIDKSEYRATKLKEIRESVKRYEQKETAVSFPWKNASNIVLPLLTIALDNLEPRLKAALVSKKPIVEIKAETNPSEYAEVIEDWFNRELEHTVNIEQTASIFIHKLLLEGTAYPIAEYTEDTELKRDFKFDEEGRVILNDNGDPETEDSFNVIFNGGKVQFAKFSDIYIPDNAENWEETPVIRKLRLTYGELMRLKKDPGYMNIGPWLLREQTGIEMSEQDDLDPSQEFVHERVKAKETIDCLECHISYTYQDKDEDDEDVDDWTEDRVIALIAKDSKILLRFILLRDVNFQNQHVIKRGRLFPESNRAYGTSLYGKMSSIQDGASDIFNLVVNVATICMIPWFIYSDKTGFESDSPEISPGKGIKADNPGEVVFPKFNIQPNAYIEFIMLFISLWERLGSIGDMQIGRQRQQSNSTATETLAVIQEGNLKHNYQSQTIKAEFIALIRTLYDLYYTHMPFDTTYVYKGKDTPILRSLMQRPLKFRLTGSTDLSNDIIDLRKNEQMYATLRKDPIVNPVELLKDIINSFKPEADTEKYINPQINQLLQIVQERPEIMQMIQQYMQQIAGQQQTEGGQTPQAPASGGGPEGV